jgi:hypothetical protein
MTIVAKKHSKKEEVRKAFKLLADSFKIPITEGDYPLVDLSNDGGNYYQPGNRTIYLDHGPLKGSTLFEETSHALRDLVQRRAGISPESQDKQVQEFYGRAGETIGRYLADGAGLSYTFFDDPARDMNDPELKKRWISRLLGLRKSRNSLRAIQTNNRIVKDGLREMTAANYDELSKVFVDLRERKIDVLEFQERLRGLESNYRSGVSSLAKANPNSIYPIDLTEVNHYLSKYGYLKDALGIALSASGDEEKRKLIERGIAFIVEGHNPKSFQFDIDDPGISETGNKTDLGIFSHFSHRKPYLYAQQYSAEELMASGDFYSLSDKEVKQRFFRKKVSPLEQRVGVLTGFFFFFSLIFFLDQIKMTGFAVALSEEVNFVLGSVLGLIFVFFLVTFFAIKLSKKHRTF